jgi:signal transduction histidine kinase/DNA-binding response OmpR family regulator
MVRAVAEPPAAPVDDAAVLIVDDEPDVASAVAEQLARDGHEVLIASSGAEARRLYACHAIALVLLDLRLPDLNGLTLLRELRATPDPPDVVVVTGHASLESAVDAMDAGASGYVEKPLDFARLRQIVFRSLERRRLQRENAALIAQLDARRRQTETLYAISSTMTSTLDLTEALRRLCREFARLFGADTASAYLHDPASDLLVPAAAYHVPPDFLPLLGSLALPLREQGFYLPLWNDRRPIWSDDVLNDRRFGHEAFRRFPHQSGLMMPLVMDDAVVGGFYLVWWQERRQPTDDERRIGEQVCDQVSLFLRNARLFEQAERDRRRLATLNAIGRRLAEVHETDQILTLIVEEACAQLGADASGIRLIEDGGLVVKARAGAASGLMPQLRLAIGEGLSGQVVMGGAPLMIEDVSAAEVPAVSRDGLVRTGMHAFLGMPLRAEGRIIGSLNMYWRERRLFPADVVTLVATIADQASLVIAKGRLLQQTEDARAVLARLYATSIAMESSWSVDDRLDAFVTGGRDTLGFDRVAVFLLDASGMRLELARQQGEDGALPLTLPVAPEAGAVYDALTTRRPVVVISDDDLRRVRPVDAAFREHPHMRSSRFVVAPLVVGERVVGVAIADNKPSRRAIEPARVEAFTLLCQQLATALESARLYADARAREREAGALYDVANELASRIGVDEIFALINRKTVEVVGGDAAGICEFDDSRGGLVYRHSLNLPPGLTSALVLRPGEGVAGRAFAERRPVWTADLGNDPDIRYAAQAAAVVTAYAPRSLLAVPIIGQGEVYGVLCNYYQASHPFTAEEIRLLSTLAHHAAVAVEKARLFDEAETQRQRLAGIFDSTSDGMMLVGTDGQIVSANRRAAELLGFDAAASAPAGRGAAPGELGLTGVLVRHFPSEGDYHTAVAPLHAAVAGDGLGEGDLELPLAGRTLHWVARPAGAVAGGTAVTLTFHDVTQEREVSRMKSDFVSFVTHQLRTPLAGIRWMLELTAAGLPPEDETTSFVTDARSAAERLIGLVNDLLDISRLESGKVGLAVENVDLAAITHSVLADLDGLVREKGHEVDVAFAADVPPLKADPQLLRQVLLNLLGNAVKYTPPDGRIAVRLGLDGGYVVWSVRDSGIGISADGQRRLFEKFYRADNARTVETEGTGLGLYLVKLIVERHGGRAWCESEEGVGTMLAFALPL